MTNKTAANRYARALFDVAIAETANLEAVEQELAAFSDLLTTHPVLGKVLLNPAVPAPRKGSAVAALVKSAQISPMVARLLALLAERDRLVLLPDLVTSYRDRLLDHQKVVRAEVISSAPLAADRAKAIEQSIARVTGRSVRLSTRVDADLIGGIVARVGGTIYDGSVTMQLRKMKQRLTEGM